MPKLLYILVASLGTFLVLMTASALLSRLFAARSIKRLIRTIGKNALPNVSAERLQGLPEPIQRYLRYALKDGHPNIRYAVLQQRARFRHGPNRPWFTVTATEVLSGMEPGFVWEARLRHNAFWWRTATLSYVNGVGHGHVKLYGALTLSEYEGKETDASMLFRVLSELVWLPTGLLPTKTLRWDPIDATTARATIVDGTTRVSATVHVNELGQIDRIVTNDKYRDHKSGFEQATFTLECKAYQEVEGVMIPTEVNFVWNLENGDFEYGQFRITRVRYVYA